MNKATQAIVEQAAQLSVNEKIELIDALLATVDKPDAEIDALWASEAESRLSAYRNGELLALDLNQVLAKYR
ncbi:addiction module protein [Methylobacillus arboreus]|uniref:addiction module protein n=1 Tax=Methylobacillus arboreus TaxID=755170 RepID=UPI001E39A8FD|nr:addiction module protein [Methylobacillus arboreus]MCB5190592.1 addiction module protein [Methylobacillus arboreus]